jgi:hypothetical protein
MKCLPEAERTMNPAIPSLLAALISFVFSLSSASGEDGIVQQKTIVRGTAGVIEQDVRNAATRMQAAIDKRNELAAERRNNIERLTAELQRCGDCPSKRELSDELDLWKRREAAIHAAEAVAIKAMGLEKYGDMRGIKAAWADYLEHYNVVTPAEKAKLDLARAANAARQYCEYVGNAAGEANAHDRPIRTKCLSEYEPNDMVLQQQIALAYCNSQKERAPTTEKTRLFYRNECLEWNDPTKRLTLLTLRMVGVPFENQAEKKTVEFWCKYVGVKKQICREQQIRQLARTIRRGRKRCLLPSAPAKLSSIYGRWYSGAIKRSLNARVGHRTILIGDLQK